MQNLQSQWQMTQRPLFAYDDEKTLVFVNTAVPLGKGEASTVKVTEPGRGADGLPTQIEYAITLKITKTLLISDADFRPIHPKTPDEERMRQVRLIGSFQFGALDFQFLLVFSFPFSS